MDWIDALQHLRVEGTPGALVTVIAIRGHAPREAGAKMVVGPTRIWGTVGGGNLEHVAIRRARDLLAEGSVVPALIEVRLNDHTPTEYGRQCCGGEVTLLVEPLQALPVVAIFGVGHVGYELARILARLEVCLHLVDSRAEQLDPLRMAAITDGVADVRVHRALLGETVLEQLPRGAHVVVMTHDHAEDFALCDAALRLESAAAGRFGSIGVIGSQAKAARFRQRLGMAGHSATVIDSLRCPIGSTTFGKQPAAIAISVAAELSSALAPVGRSAGRLRSGAEPATS